MLNSKELPHQNGRVVKVLHRAFEDDPIYGAEWKPSGEPSWVIEPLFDAFTFPYLEPYAQLPCRDTSLIPIHPKTADRILAEAVNA